jgi:UDP-N-acetyl-D-glucosamine dehydrogenase
MEVSVIGQGYVGLPIAISAAESGFKVGGFDIDVEKINNLKNGISDSPEVTSEILNKLQSQNMIMFSENIDDHKNSKIYVIAVPTPLDNNHQPDLHYLINACEILSKIVKPGDLIINESTSFIGTLRDLISPTIVKLSGIKEIEFAVAPERIDPGNVNWNVKNTPRVLSGITDEATKRALDFYRNFCDVVLTVSRPEVAEAAKLFENTFRQVNIALVNQFSDIAHKFNFSAHETITAAATKPFGFMPFFPSIGVGGHCIPVDPSYLAYSAIQVGIEPSFINSANEINLLRPNKVVEMIKKELNQSLKGKKIQIAGITYKPNIPDLRESPAIPLIKELELNGAYVTWYDPYVDVQDSRQSSSLMAEIDLGLIVTPHNKIDFSAWKNSKIRVLDFSANSINYGWPKYF